LETLMPIPRSYKEGNQQAAGPATRITDPLRHPGSMGLTTLTESEILDLPNWRYRGPAIMTLSHTGANGQKIRIRGLVCHMVRESMALGGEGAIASFDMYCTLPTILKHHPAGAETAEALCKYYDLNVSRNLQAAAAAKKKAYPADRRRSPEAMRATVAQTPATAPPAPAAPAAPATQQAATTATQHQSLWARLNGPATVE
jgi:hypothetical protein